MDFQVSLSESLWFGSYITANASLLLGWRYRIYSAIIWYGFNVIVFDISSKYLLGHYVENTGNSTLLFLEIFRSGSVYQTICRVSNSLSFYRIVPGYLSHSVACTDATRACQSTSGSRWRYHCQFLEGQARGRRPRSLINQSISAFWTYLSQR